MHITSVDQCHRCRFKSLFWLNVRGANTKQLLDKTELAHLANVVNLQDDRTYVNKESIKELRYQKVILMADQDHSGSHYKSLILNAVHTKWPNLLKPGFFEGS